ISGDANGETVSVAAYGITQTYSGVKKIVANAGSGHNTIDAQGVLAETDLTAGPDGDTLTAGDGVAVLTGGTGPDSLTGGHGTDSINGGGGDDVIYAGLGTSLVSGGPGHNTIHDPASTATVTETGKNFTLTDALLTFDSNQDTLDGVTQASLVGDNTGDTFDV